MGDRGRSVVGERMAAGLAVSAAGATGAPEGVAGGEDCLLFLA